MEAGVVLQIGPGLINRVANVDVTWHKDMAPTPWASPEFDLTLDQRSVLDAVNQLTFTQLKREYLCLFVLRLINPAAPFRVSCTAPGAPQLIPEDSTAENNCVTVAWQQHAGSFVQGYVLELDDGNAGPFRAAAAVRKTPPPPPSSGGGLTFGAVSARPNRMRPAEDRRERQARPRLCGRRRRRQRRVPGTTALVRSCAQRPGLIGVDKAAAALVVACLSPVTRLR
ncbi:hypothetical protein HPB48_025094 [Haemaphysalis longicornis]|uniref:Uncharacterized protein n=1 Tax=Haemaphysalis longicornis TaxID=44386 RepID=A0A9J6H8U8_HAELO|nr:hypothetical protein HPB48_025094 [Haemaphysalis longicornis]